MNFDFEGQGQGQCILFIFLLLISSFHLFDSLVKVKQVYSVILYSLVLYKFENHVLYPNIPVYSLSEIKNLMCHR